MNKKIEVALRWDTEFETESEVQEFIARIAGVHAEMYGTGAVGKALASDGEYHGAVNHITVKVHHPRTDIRAGDRVNIKQYKDDEYNSEGRVIQISEDGKSYRVSNLNMPFMGTVNDWFTADEVEAQ